MRRHQAASPFALAVDRPAVGLDDHERADRVAIRAGADELEPNPAPGGRRVVAKNRRRAVLVADHEVEVAVVVQVADGQAVADVVGREVGARARLASWNRLPARLRCSSGGWA